MIRAFVLLFLVITSAAQAEVPERLEQAFRTWHAQVEANAAVMTIWYAGEHRRDVEIGVAADVPLELASLGKAITAVCVSTLMQSGVWTEDTTSAEVLGYGPPTITLSQLLTHSAGLAPDMTQVAMQLWLNSSEDRAGVASARALGREVQLGDEGHYRYNNENYAILGAMIAAQTGQSYADFCRQAVLVPAGLTSAQISPNTGSFAAWGGWQMSVQDYARFMHWAYGAEGRIGALPGSWPATELGGGAQYGMGMFQRPFRESHNYWHFGLLCFPGRLNAGSYAVSWMGQWSVVVAFDRCLNWDQLGALDSALSAAVFE